MTRVHSLEARIPFLNPSVVGVAKRLPLSLRTKKRALFETFGHLLTISIFERRKKGFGVPVGLWAWKPGTFRDQIYDTLGSRSAKFPEYLNPKMVDRLLQEHDRLPLHGHQLWCLFILEIWLQRLQ